MIFKKKIKIFCIGAGKTGTTSIEKALFDLGYKMGNQSQGEMLLNDYSDRNFAPILKFCKTADAFQDAPFCFKHLYVALDQTFPDSKFILSVRDSEEQWYNSFIQFQSKLFADGQRMPTVDDLKNANYRYKGYVWEVRQKVYGITEKDDPYDAQILKKYYQSHNNAILDYFRNKNNLLILNLSDKSSYKKLCNFLNKKPLYNEFPWKNKTSAIK
ncbi:sulfotransferase [Rasiella sp. SM2506]|uniref:sulfotransferase n=1 Tax=Rasiella sp. SM2506 TaxID=3423914 RepID=UPI003D7915AB